MIQVIGDDIHFDGHLVGRLADCNDSTVMANFCEALENVTEEETFTANEVQKLMEKAAKGGLVRLSEIDWNTLEPRGG